MSTEMDAQLAEVLRQTQEMRSAVDEQLHQLNTRTFNGTDDAKSVAVTLNGRQRLTGLYIQDGLLRLGTDVVAQRINEAIHAAQATATAAIEADQRRFCESMEYAAGSLKEILGVSEAKSV